METKDLINQAINLLEVALAQLDAKPAVPNIPPLGSPIANANWMIQSMVNAGHEGQPVTTVTEGTGPDDHASRVVDLANPGSWRTIDTHNPEMLSLAVPVRAKGTLTIGTSEVPGNDVGQFLLTVAGQEFVCGATSDSKNVAVEPGTYTISIRTNDARLQNVVPGGRCVQSIRVSFTPA